MTQDLKRNWMWFMATNSGGQWILCEGNGDIAIAGSKVSGSLILAGEDEVYMGVSGELSGDSVCLRFSSRRSDVPPFELHGIYSQPTASSGGSTQCIMVSDGVHCIGITRAP